MKNKLRFIMPRLLGATLVAGLATLIIATLFKLLLGVTLLAGAVALAARAIGKKRRHLLPYGQSAMPGFNNVSAFGSSGSATSPIQPVAGYATKKGTTIVPIN